GDPKIRAGKDTTSGSNDGACPRPLKWCMAMFSAAAAIARYKGELEDQLEGNPELQEALQNPELLKSLIRKPGSKLAGAGFRLGTAALLKNYAWPTVIASFGILDGGLALLYLNFHFIARHIANKKGFTPFGSEWSTWRTVLGWPSFALKYAEIIALVFLDMLVLLIVLGIATLIGMVAYALAHPCAFVGKIGYEAAVTIAALGGPAAATGVLGCTVVNAVAG
ncbi:MAG: hypothetical protein Q7R41_05715, partial [Phycisphaerales bacterium]|nr:hypothetical protein [Phycisphaerales bacterium]